MSWRLHLSNKTVQRLDIISGKPSVLAAWMGARQISLLDMQNGSILSERQIDVKSLPTALPETTDGWEAIDAYTRTSNNRFLPFLRLPTGIIFYTAEGNFRLVQSNGGDLILWEGDAQARLHLVDASATGDLEATQSVIKPVIVALGFDRSQGITAVLDATAALYLFHKKERVALISTDLHLTPDVQPMLLVSKGTAAVFVCDGQRISSYDAKGGLRRSIELHYRAGAINCSSDGRRLIVSDTDANVIRVYNGSTLVPTHQRFVIDLLADARRVQEMASRSNLANAAVGPVAINSKDVVAFAIAGVVCVTSLSKMSALPPYAAS